MRNPLEIIKNYFANSEPPDYNHEMWDSITLMQKLPVNQWLNRIAVANISSVAMMIIRMHGDYNYVSRADVDLDYQFRYALDSDFIVKFLSFLDQVYVPDNPADKDNIILNALKRKSQPQIQAALDPLGETIP